METGRIKTLITILIATALISLFLTGCPSPLDSVNLSILQDQNGPIITIASPSQESEYESSITISGTIIDLDNSGISRTTDAGSYIKSASYMVLNHDTGSTEVVVSDDGSFSFSIETADYSTQISVYITSEDLNGNESTKTLTLNPDTEGPNLVITSPDSEYTEYSTSIILEGYVTDSISGTSFSEVCTEIAYEISGTTVSGTVSISQTDGSFSTTIDASSVDGSRTLEITAEDLNFNTTTVVIDIEKPDDGGDISGFTLTPGNKQVTISWDAVPNAESYSIYESSFDNTISLTDSSATSYNWTDLTNGLKYSFQVTAVIPDEIGDDAVSSEKATIPLNNRIFTPYIKEVDYQTISIAWNEHTDIDSFTIKRSTSADGPWDTIRSNLNNNEFTDSRLVNDTTYYYRISPTDYDDIISDYVTAVPDRFDFGIVGSLYTINASNIAVAGDYAYVTGWSSGLKIVDISNPENPSVTGSYDSLAATYAHDIAYSDGYVYIAEDDVLEIVDCRIPFSPSYEGRFDAEDSVEEVAVSGDYAYIYGEDKPFYKIDISTPSTPTVNASTSNIAGRPEGIIVSGDYAYFAIADYSVGGLYIYDISASGSITKQSNYNSINNFIFNYGIDVSGNYAYVVYSDTLWIADCTTKSSPSIAGTYGDISDSSKVAVLGNYAYIADTDLGLLKIDCASPAAPSLNDKCITNSTPTDIAISGNYAFVTEGSSGLEIIDIGLPDSPVLAGNNSSVSEAQDLTIVGNYGYVTDSDYGLRIVDVSNPKSPVLAGSCYTYDNYGDSGNYTHDVSIAGDYAYVVNEDTGLKIIDISTPSSPSIIGSYDISGEAYSVKVTGEYAYLSTEDSGLVILDITAPESPSFTAKCTTSGRAYGVTVSGDYAYIADYTEGLQIIDINPYSSDYCEIVAYCDTDDANDVAVSGNYAYIADGWAGLKVIDINPDSNNYCTIVSSCDTPGDAIDLSISGDYLYIADSSGGLQTIDISAPLSVDNNSIIGNYDPGSIYGVTVAGSYAYVAAGYNGLQVVNLLGE